jgi:hypothetical protein
MGLLQLLLLLVRVVRALTVVLSVFVTPQRVMGTAASLLLLAAAGRHLLQRRGRQMQGMRQGQQPRRGRRGGVQVTSPSTSCRQLGGVTELQPERAAGTQGGRSSDLQLYVQLGGAAEPHVGGAAALQLDATSETQLVDQLVEATEVQVCGATEVQLAAREGGGN